MIDYRALSVPKRGYEKLVPKWRAVRFVVQEADLRGMSVFGEVGLVLTQGQDALA